ncbi:MAG: sigma 54-interacting transcriptional regulator [Terriglobia bacterium]
MEANRIRLWFYSADAAFAEVISRALGAEFDAQHSDELSMESTEDQTGRWDVILLNLQEAGDEGSPQAGFSFLARLSRLEFPLPVIVLLDEHNRDFARKAMTDGAYATMVGPPDIVELRQFIRRACKHYKAEHELRQLRLQGDGLYRLYDLIGVSEPMQQVFSLVRKTAPCDVTVLVTGETGTGKGLLSRAIHQLSARSAGPFVSFSCANLPETLIEDELFGHEKGAFTGAIGIRRGRFEVADRGTLFLDEIGDLALGLQSKLLRVLQERCFERLGNNNPVETNFRLICATHRDLAAMVKEGKFREDLFYRLHVLQIHVPPLRERRDGIPVLAHHFLQRFAKEFGKQVHRFSRAALQAMEEYEWPGNVRELENVIQRAIVLAEGATIEASHLPEKLRGASPQRRTESTYEDEVRNFKRRLVMRTLLECDWCKVEAARRLGVARSYLHRLITQLEISPMETEAVANDLEREAPGSRVM